MEVKELGEMVLTNKKAVLGLISIAKDMADMFLNSTIPEKGKKTMRRLKEYLHHTDKGLRALKPGDVYVFYPFVQDKGDKII